MVDEKQEVPAEETKAKEERGGQGGRGRGKRENKGRGGKPIKIDRPEGMDFKQTKAWNADAIKQIAKGLDQSYKNYDCKPENVKA